MTVRFVLTTLAVAVGFILVAAVVSSQNMPL